MKIVREFKRLIRNMSNFPPSVQHNRGWDYTPEAIRTVKRNIDFTGSCNVKLTAIPEGWIEKDGKAIRQ